MIIFFVYNFLCFQEEVEDAVAVLLAMKVEFKNKFGEQFSSIQPVESDEKV